jgi:hypothetical protein
MVRKSKHWRAERKAKERTAEKDKLGISNSFGGGNCKKF